MNSYEVTRMVYARVQAMEPEVVTKIMGFLLLQDQGEQELVKLAFGPDAQLQALISKVKQQMGLHGSGTAGAAGQQQASAAILPPIPLLPSSTPSSLSAQQQSSSLRHPGNLYSSPPPLLVPGLDPYPFLGTEEGGPLSSPLHHHHQHHAHLGQHFSDGFSTDFLSSQLSAAAVDKFHHQLLVDPPPPAFFSPRPTICTTRRPSSLSDIPLSPDSGCLSPAARKPCLYYARGYCKHGSNCRFLHSHARSDPVSPSFSSSSCASAAQYESRSDDGLMPGSLDRLEVELQELLRGRRAPVSIASLPQLYYERFGRTLQAEGYLTESQRHGKAGYSLTKLLARLKNSVTLIDRPHGQHAVILAEDAPRFTSYRSERDDYSAVNPGSRQIYLTFPAESTFLEEDVSKHFGAYGPVQDVRIPFQQKRMFGFVTFVYPDTVRAILAKGNPHYICGARVLVKPYKEKGKHSERKLAEREHSRFLPSRSFDGREYPFPSVVQFFDDHDLLRRQLINEQALELERRRFADLHYSDSTRLYVETGANSQCGMNSSNGIPISPGDLSSTTPEDLTPLQASSAFGYLLDVLDGDPCEDEKPSEKAAAANDVPSGNEHNLPDSPFASPHANVEQASLSELPNDAFPNSSVQQQQQQSFFLPPPQVPNFDDNDLTCPICRGFFVDPIPLDCSHIFCIQCILKVIRVSKDECPVCRRHIGSQVVKLLENRGLPLIDPSLTKAKGGSWPNYQLVAP